MVRKFKMHALVGALVMLATPALAQVPPGINPLGIDLDPMHIFSNPTPAPAPMAKPMMKKKKMMSKKMMMKKKMMKKPMMKKKMMKKKM